MDTTTIQVKVYHTCPEAWHLQCSVSVQFNSLPIMTLTAFCFCTIQQTSNHDTYSVLFLYNSTDFQSWHLQCSVSIQFNSLPSTGHETNTAQPKADKCPSSASHFSLLRTLWLDKGDYPKMCMLCSVLINSRHPLKPSMCLHVKIFWAGLTEHPFAFNQDRHCNTHRNGNCPDNTTHLAVHLDCDLCRHRHQLFCFIQCARNHHLRRYCKTNQINHAVKMTIETIN